ncbi:MAG: lycopene cyclase domain-containing protein [Vicingaceae bacterium]
MDFLESKYLYFYLMLFTMAYPLAQSFEHRLTYYKNWTRLFMGIAAMMLLFIPWDIYFTHQGVWWFNDKYISGIKFLLLPLEEWLFFILVPFACIFIYEVLEYFFKKDVLKSLARPAFLVMGIGLGIGSLIYSDRQYTFVTFALTAVALLIAFILNPSWKGRFLLMYLVCWLPFLLVNGALTGSFTFEAVVNYNPSEIIGLRIFTIPVEDSIYNMLMLIMVTAIYKFKKKSA